MKKRTWTESLARACARNKWWTVGIWGVVIVLAVLANISWLSGAMVTNATFSSKPESVAAYDILKARLGDNSKWLDEMIIIKSPTYTVDDPAFKTQVNNLYAELSTFNENYAKGAMTYYQTQAPTMVSKDRHATMIPFKVYLDDYKPAVTKLYALGDKYQTQDFKIYHTGNAAMMQDEMTLSEKTMSRGEMVGIGVALVVLALVFGTLAAALFPVMMGLAAIIVALGLTAVVGQFMDLTFMVTSMITMIGLAVGIDYSLFILTRFREERAKGVEKMDAIGTAGSTANKAVFYSGLTVMLALCGLVIFPLSIFISMGIGAILVVLASIVASMTLLPALVGIFGDKVNSWRIPFIPRSKPVDPKGETKGFWALLTRTVTRAPAVSIVLVVAVLVAAIIPFFDKKSGMSGISETPDYLRSKQGYMVLLSDFNTGLDQPNMIIIDGDINAAATQTAMAALQDKIKNDSIYATATIETHPELNLAVINAVVNGDTMSQEAMASITRIRHDYIPATFTGVPAKALVTGNSAFMLDYNIVTDNYTPIIFAFVLSLSFIVLLLAFRSIVIPFTAIIMNLLSVGASYGLIVLVFQKGYGAGILGLTQVQEIETWLPLFLFAVLFGLSMDYQVFLLSRIREHYKQYGDNAAAVSFGVQSTGKLITGAALIMVAVFSGFALSDMVMMQQMGFGLAVAVFLDATIIRCVLVPATMKLLGKANWYLPKWLNWLPNISIGENNDTHSTITGNKPSRTPGKRSLEPAPAVIREDPDEDNISNWQVK